jgi:hypothetical protein
MAKQYQRNPEAAGVASVTPAAPLPSALPKSMVAIFEEFLAAVRSHPDAQFRAIDRGRFPHSHEAMKHLAAHEQCVVDLRFVMKK